MIDPAHYSYRVMWSEEDGEFVALCSEFPSLSFLASSHTKALKGITDVVADVIGDMQESAEPIPEPLASKHYSGKLMLRIPPEQHRMLAMQAAEYGISLNRHIVSRLNL